MQENVQCEIKSLRAANTPSTGDNTHIFSRRSFKAYTQRWCLRQINTCFWKFRFWNCANHWQVDERMNEWMHDNQDGRRSVRVCDFSRSRLRPRRRSVSDRSTRSSTNGNARSLTFRASSRLPSVTRAVTRLKSTNSRLSSRRLRMAPRACDARPRTSQVLLPSTRWAKKMVQLFMRQWIRRTLTDFFWFWQ